MIEHDELCNLIPHSFNMCLIDHVVSWDADKIVCTSKSHLLESNPLRRKNSLSSIHLLEYAAQTMAIHGGLYNREQDTSMSDGYLAALRDVRINLCQVEHLTSELHIKANKILSQNGNMIYAFSVYHAETELVSGRATVITISNNK